MRSLKLLPGASTRETIEETEEMLIGIVVRSVTSKESCALDGSPIVKGARHAESRKENNRIDKVKNNVFLLVANSSCLKMNTGVRLLSVFRCFWFRSKYWFLLAVLVYYRCKFGVYSAR